MSGKINSIRIVFSLAKLDGFGRKKLGRVEYPYDVILTRLKYKPNAQNQGNVLLIYHNVWQSAGSS